MPNYDEQKLIEESTKHVEFFLQREQRTLATFTGDSSLMYMPDPKLERFLLNPSKGILYLPLAAFLDRDLDENQILWHIYYELAMYPDWKKQTKAYLYRGNEWKKEKDRMTGYILHRIEKEGLGEDRAYQPDIIAGYVKKEILDALHRLDKLTSFLRVLQMCPVYRDEANFKKIAAYMEQTGIKRKAIDEMPKHRAFINGFILKEIYKMTPDMKGCGENPFSKRILNQPFFDFIHSQLVRQINSEEGVLERDSLIRSFIYPVFEQLWKEEIDAMDFFKSQGASQEQVSERKSPFEQPEEEKRDTLESTEDEVKTILKEMLDQQERNNEIVNIMTGKVDLTAYGISQNDQQLFQYYSNKMKSEREQMRQFWSKLIGDAKKEISVKKDGQIKGKLDVSSFIAAYPDFVEAEKKGKYKNLPVFSRYLLETQADKLPERIEISFVIDNSGSMNAAKIESAREALAVTLLSIDDLNRYLKRNAEQLNQKIEVLSETWFFGSQYYHMKEFNDKPSIVRLNSNDGATDDASCLKEISGSITPAEERQLKKGKHIKIVFEITDGASSFPGLAKNAVQELLSKDVALYAFQIGKNSTASESAFNFVWNDGYKEPHGIIIGEQVEKLPKELLKAVKRNMQSIFKG